MIPLEYSASCVIGDEKNESSSQAVGWRNVKTLFRAVLFCSLLLAMRTGSDDSLTPRKPIYQESTEVAAKSVGTDADYKRFVNGADF